MSSLLAAAILALNVSAKEPAKKKMEWNGATGGGDKPGQELIATQAEWDELWKRLRRPAPPADLTKQVAAAVFLGQRRTGGYGVVWLEPKTEKDSEVLRWKERTPAPDAMVMQMITDPWSVKLFPKTGKRPRLEAEKP